MYRIGCVARETPTIYVLEAASRLVREYTHRARNKLASWAHRGGGKRATISEATRARARAVSCMQIYFYDSRACGEQRIYVYQIIQLFIIV